MKWYEDYNTFLARFESSGELMDETTFYFRNEEKEEIHYIGCLLNYDNPYWVGYCDMPDGCEFSTAKEMFEAKIFDGRSIKERWNELVIVGIGGIRIKDWV
ncbi:hypothetical protein [Anaerovibrio sp. RM50]|uniref:hypothetical protein n=1 Tax=Anaerovibrio sp. RM50 TaxID=1200557 RepID=UPI000488D9A6|nr:hypothetical protein [Anaerovibrio sp. RM50]